MGAEQIVKNLRLNLQSLGIILVFMVGYVAFATKSDLSSNPAQKQRPITVGLFKDIDEDVLGYFWELTNKLRPVLESECESVDFVPFNELDQLCDRLKKGEIDIAGELTPIQYVENYAENGFKPFLGIEYDGSPYYHSVLFAPNDVDDRFNITLKDMPGRDNLETIINLIRKHNCTIALKERPSTSGYYYPISYLLDKGIDLSDIKDKRKELKDHKRIYREVLIKNPKNAFIAGFLANYRFRRYKEDPNSVFLDGEDYYEPFIIDKSDPIPNGVFVISKRAIEELDEDKLIRIWKTVQNIPNPSITGWRSNVERDLKLVEQHRNRVYYAERFSQKYPLLLATFIATMVVLMSGSIYIYFKIRV